MSQEDGANWQLVYTKQAQKDAHKLASSNLKDKVEELLAVLAENPFQNPPSYEKLVGDLQGAYSRRINIQHPLVYEIIESEQVVKIIRMWTHYE
ncbi:MAG: Txe/YoeB family addiction module toxin [Nostoc sp. DedQUE12a]|nr:Txe/YoeB family addiction module toxin [Nostoc sp. DedQUE12a]